MTTNRPLRVFLCHSSADKPAVRELYQKLRAEPWIEPWLDEEELFPGMNWNMEIEKAIEETDVIIVCLSNNSITKEGYVQKEIKTALDYSDYKPEGSIFIIPLRLEECDVPSRLSKFQWLDIKNPDWYETLQKTLQIKIYEKRSHLVLVLTLFAQLKNKNDYNGFISALRNLEALYSEGKLSLSSWQQEELVNARKWFDEKRTKDGARISVSNLGDLNDTYKTYQDALHSRDYYFIGELDYVDSREHMLGLLQDNYERKSREYADKILSDVQRYYLESSPVYALGFLQKSLDDLPFIETDKKRLTDMIGEIKRLNEKLEQSAEDFIFNILSEDEKKVVDQFIRGGSVDNTSRILLVSQQVVEILIDSACEKLKRTYNLDQVNSTILANYLRPYWNKYI